MADKSDSSFSYIEEYNEDSENDSFFMIPLLKMRFLFMLILEMTIQKLQVK